MSPASEDSYQLQRTKRLYSELFEKHTKLRYGTFILGALLLPLLVSVLYSAGAHGASTVLLLLALVMVSISEFMDRFLFYATSVPLQVAGAFFAGKQRH